MNDDFTILLQICMYAVTFGVFYGTTSQRLKQLERKIESQQEMFERICQLHGSLDTAHIRISDLRKELQLLKQSQTQGKRSC